jgi:DNA-binding CsgD family transcriptional regulator
MSRPKRISSEGREFRTDRELVYAYQHCRKPENKMRAANELWEKYFKLRMKMKHELISLCLRNGLKMPEVIEEYDSEAWIKFIEQFDGIDLERVAHIQNWSIYIRLWGYWRSMNRDMLKHWFDWQKNTTPIHGVKTRDDKDLNDSLTNLDIHEAEHHHDQTHNDIEVNNARAVFWEALEQLKDEITPSQYKLINMKYKGIKNREIMKTLSISTKTLNDNLTDIKSKLVAVIARTAKKKGLDLNYNDLIEVLA